jgi:TonB family protein
MGNSSTARENPKTILAMRTAALLLAATAAAGPADAAARKEGMTVASWVAEAGKRVDTVSEVNPIYRPDRPTISTVAVTFGKRGYFTRARLDRSSGNPTFDYRAIDIARATNFPRLPETLRGAPATVLVRIHFGEDALPVEPAHLAIR